MLRNNNKAPAEQNADTAMAAFEADLPQLAAVPAHRAKRGMKYFGISLPTQARKTQQHP